VLRSRLSACSQCPSCKEDSSSRSRDDNWLELKVEYSAKKSHTRMEHSDVRLDMVGRCKLKGLELRVESAWCQRLRVKCDTVFSSFGIKFNLRRYYVATIRIPADTSVGRRRLTPG